VDDYYGSWHAPGQLGTNGSVYSLGSDGQGRVYGAGAMGLFFCPCYNIWWVRGSSIGGTNWGTKLVFSSGYGWFHQGTCAGEDVYAAGSADDGDIADLGLILRSSDHGATWATNFQALHDFPHAITGDPAGNLYSAEYSGTSTSIIWLVRRAAPGGTNWSTLDRSEYQIYLDGSLIPGAHYPYATSIAADAAGNVCVTGALIESWVTSGTYRWKQSWYTRQYQAATDQWSTTDLFSYSANPTNMHGIALATTIAPSGSVFTVGFGTSDSGQQRWLVRKRAAPSPLAQARALEKAVNDMVARGTITGERASVLLALLDRIVADVEQGKSASVCNGLLTFSKIVQQLVKQGTLVETDGQLLMNGTDNLSLILGCRER